MFLNIFGLPSQELEKKLVWRVLQNFSINTIYLHLQVLFFICVTIKSTLICQMTMKSLKNTNVKFFKIGD